MLDKPGGCLQGFDLGKVAKLQRGNSLRVGSKNALRVIDKPSTIARVFERKARMFGLLIRWVVCTLIFLAYSALSPAQTFPVKPIRLVVGFAAGGSTDVFARAIVRHAAQPSELSLGQLSCGCNAQLFELLQHARL